MAGKHRKKRKKTTQSKWRMWLFLSLFLVILVGAVAGSLFAFYGCQQARELTQFKSIPLKMPARKIYCPLDGREVSKESLIQRRPLLVKVENLSDARPQSGLDKACIIYEAMAEGGITRFAVVYLCQEAEEIGPIRSARLQDIDLVHEYDALFAHAGSSDAYAEADKSDLADLDEFAYTDAYWRSDERVAPHNLYSSTDKLRETAREKGLEKSVLIKGFTFKKDNPGAGKVTSLYIPYPADCDVRYEYDAKTNRYLRSVANEPHTDKITGARLAPKNVIIQYITYTPAQYGEQYGLGERMIMNLVGEGKAQIFRDGEMIEGRWSKPSSYEPTTFTDLDGNPIKFNRGQIWIEQIPTTWEVSITQAE